MYMGWASLAGVELFNAARTVAYVEHMMPGLEVSDCYGCADLATVLGDKAYTSPLVDQPPWFEASKPDTWEFYGVYPLTAQGVEDSTIDVTVTELAGDGGYVSQPRRGSREMRFTALLIGATDAAVQSGMTYLRRILAGDGCRSSSTGCTGDHFCYLAACPEVCEDSPDYPTGDTSPTRLCPDGAFADPVETCVLPYERHLYGVSLTAGPTVLQEYNVSCGAMWEVEFTLVAGVPYAYGTPQWVGRTDGTDVASRVIDEVPCVTPTPTYLQDPDCAVVPSPPRPPVITNDCIATPSRWRRFQVMIPVEFVPTWSDAVPLMEITTGPEAARQVRVRFYPNPFGRDLTKLAACDFCGEFVISYIPPSSTMTINGITSAATVEQPGGSVVPANHLLYGTDGGPVSWPLLGCGTAYTMTIDVDPPASIGDATIALCLATRE